MTRKTQNKTIIGDKILYKVITPNGWSIIIMPDNILIDNYFPYLPIISKYFPQSLVKMMKK